MTVFEGDVYSITNCRQMLDVNNTVILNKWLKLPTSYLLYVLRCYLTFRYSKCSVTDMQWTSGSLLLYNPLSLGQKHTCYHGHKLNFAHDERQILRLDAWDLNIAYPKKVSSKLPISVNIELSFSQTRDYLCRAYYIAETSFEHNCLPRLPIYSL